jgi:hypothetical protein
MTRPQNLMGDNRQLYEAWTSLGMSSEAAMESLRESGWLPPESDRDRLARSLRETWGLSEAAAEVAAHGRDGSSARSMSEAPSLSSLRPNPSNIRYVVGAIEEIASGLCHEGVAWDKPLREAAVKVMLKVPDDRTADWVARIAHRFWPQIYSDSGSSGTVHG